jgi:hypothetical protein
MTRLGGGFVLVLALLASSSLQAQNEIALPDPGARVRLYRIDAGGWRTATFVALERDTLLVRRSGCCAVDTVPLSKPHALDVSRGKGFIAGNMVNGMLLGAVAGGAVGLVAGKIDCNAHPGELCDVGASILGILGAGVGFVVGGVIGGTRKGDYWERVYPPQRAALWEVPDRNKRVMIGLTFPVEVR